MKKKKKIAEEHIIMLIESYTTINDDDDDSLFELKGVLKTLNYADLRLFVIYSEYNGNLKMCSRYFKNTAYYTKKRIKKIQDYILSQWKHFI